MQQPVEVEKYCANDQTSQLPFPTSPYVSGISGGQALISCSKALPFLAFAYNNMYLVQGQFKKPTAQQHLLPS